MSGCLRSRSLCDVLESEFFLHLLWASDGLGVYNRTTKVIFDSTVLRSLRIVEVRRYSSCS